MVCVDCPRLKAYEEDEIDKAHNGIQMILGTRTYGVQYIQEQNIKLTNWTGAVVRIHIRIVRSTVHTYY